MKIYKFVFFIVSIPCFCMNSDIARYKNLIPSVGISTTAASITVCSLVNYAIPNKSAQAIAPWMYGTGKNLLLLGAATSALSSACIVKNLVQTVNQDVNTQYIDIAGAALPIGYLVSFVGNYLVYKADIKAHDDRLTKRVRKRHADEQQQLLPPSWGTPAKKNKKNPLSQSLLPGSDQGDIEENKG